MAKPKTPALEYKITCKTCGTDFITTRSQKVYCSFACYDKQMGRNAYRNRKARQNADATRKTD